MKFLLCLLVLLPLVYSVTVDLDSLTEEQKRFLFKIPSLDDVKNAICGVLASDGAQQGCSAACPLALNTIPYGSLASFLCEPACARYS